MGRARVTVKKFSARHLLLGVVVFAALAYFFAADFIEHPESAVAAACPFIDNDANDNDATVGVYELVSNYTVTAAATAYDRTSSAGITTFKVPSGVTLTLDGDPSTGDYAQMQFTNLEVASGGKVSADGEGCYSASAAANGWGPDTYNVCTYSTGGAGYGVWGTWQGTHGAGFGGTGGRGTWTSSSGGTVYGSATDPYFFGSSGGNSGNIYGGTGGGIIKLSVSGTLTNNGTISANGSAGNNSSGYGTGGGSGGSIFISALTINGTTGTFEAKGGAGGNDTNDGGGGGGGRISVTWDLGDFTFTSSTCDVLGGSGNDNGNAGIRGTCYVNDNNSTPGDTSDDFVEIIHGFTYADEDYNVTHWDFDASATNQYCAPGIGSGATPPITAAMGINFEGIITCSQRITSFGLYGPSQVIMGSGSDIDVAGALFLVAASGAVTVPASASLTSVGGMTLTAGTNLTVGGSASLINASSGNISLSAGSSFSLGTGVTVTNSASGGDVLFNIPNGDSQTWTDLTVNVAAQRYFLMDDAVDVDLAGSSTVNANVIWDNMTGLTIGSSAAINATGKGYPSGSGPGRANSFPSGGSYGGRGGTYPGYTLSNGPYGSVRQPSDFGSGSYPGSPNGGGGAIKLVASGTMTINGTVFANGQYNCSNTGGGSGGSVWLDAATLAGSGSVSADGGNGTCGQAVASGGGGRIAIYYTVDASTLISGGKVHAHGGTAYTSTETNAVGGAGTVFIDDKDDGDPNGRLIVDNANRSGGHNTTDQVVTASQTYDDISIVNGARYRIPSGHAPTLSSGGALTVGGTRIPSLIVNFGGALNLNAA